MIILLPTLAAAFTAFCVWLAVRIVNRRERWTKRLAWGLIAMSAIYALSSGPTRTFSMRHHLVPIRGPFVMPNGVVFGPHQPGELQIFEGEVVPTISVTDYGERWPMVYRPLAWASEQSWGAPILWYWSLFPIRRADSR
ncbi:MAG TPA: hypothetical protein VGM05_22680 [Planctomycetaceae bacterium]|jgi:hypothetical protein